MKTIDRNDVKKAFDNIGLTNIDHSTLSQCTTTANSLHLKPQVIADCWEAFSLNKKIMNLTEHSWKSFRNVLQKEADKVSTNNSNTPIEEEDDDDDDDNEENHEGAVGIRRGMGKRQVGSPDTVSSSLALITPPTKRMASGGTNKKDPSSAVDAVIADAAKTPLSVRSNASIGSNYTPPKYEERTGAGKVIVTFNPNNLSATTTTTTQTPQEQTHAKCSISHEQYTTNITKPYRHLFTTMEERAKALDQHLVHLEDILMKRYNITGKDKMIEDDVDGDVTMMGGQTNSSKDSKDEDDVNAIAPLEGVGIPRQEKICCIGRICNAAHEGRINSTSVVLEGSKHMGGARIEVDLSHLQEDKSNSFSLFPGQIIAVEGMNSTGRKMTAHRICEGAAHGPNKSTVKELLKYHHDDTHQNGMPLKIMTVCGPYTTSDNLNYDPLYDFMSVVLKEQPDVVIMVGPFVDVCHKDIQSGNATLQLEGGAGLSVPFEALFANKVAAVIDDYFAAQDNLQTQFVLVPSLDDANANFVYPQPPLQNRVFGKRGKVLKVSGNEDVEVGTLLLDMVEAGAPDNKNNAIKKYRRVHCVSNPCTFQINELVIGVTGTDSIFHMSADETNGNLVPGSRLARISQHMLQQQSYYPLFPPALGTNLDLKQMKQWNMPCQPDLLIVPSRLTSFARPVLRDTVVINPGHLSKNTTGGTYAIMDIHPMKRDALENAGGDDVELEHNIADRIRLEIRKI